MPQRKVGDCQNYGPFLGPYYNTGPNTGPNLGDPKRDHNFDNPPSGLRRSLKSEEPKAFPIKLTSSNYAELIFM